MNTYVNKTPNLTGVKQLKPFELLKKFEFQMRKGLPNNELINIRTRLHLMKNNTLSSYGNELKSTLLNFIEEILKVRNEDFEEEVMKMSVIIERLEKEKKDSFYYNIERNEIGYEDFESDYVSHWMPYIVFDNNMRIDELPYSSFEDDLWLFVLREKEVTFINDVNGGENF